MSRPIRRLIDRKVLATVPYTHRVLIARTELERFVNATEVAS